MKDIYVFPAVMTFYDDENGKGIGIYYPDLPGCVSVGDNLEDAFYMATDALEVHLLGMEEDGDIIPEPTSPIEIKYGLEPNQIVSLVRAYMPPLREAEQLKAVNKMCTLPKWLITAGKEAHINFSQTLQDALIKKLGVKRKK